MPAIIEQRIEQRIDRRIRCAMGMVASAEQFERTCERIRREEHAKDAAKQFELRMKTAPRSVKRVLYMDFFKFAAANVRLEFGGDLCHQAGESPAALPQMVAQQAERLRGGASPNVSRQICAWCPDFNPRGPANEGASHGMCQTCAAKGL